MAKQQPALDKSAHTPGESKTVEEQAGWQGREKGRIREGTTGANRPVGRSTPRDVTGINPEDRKPVDPESPFLIPA
jgi:hypothetical protein